ncbi:hypothetical protein M0R72_20315 [Candidatus Pacearchaeota archaeon]|jgi:hypothetical protein|nr:hypothetical protein [Candidatus Pacearchaeota archaeon]
MDLSAVPLQVLEKVRNKWEKILVYNRDQVLYDPCAMCRWVDETDGYSCFGNCPILYECEEILDASPGWNERRERFLLHIRAEIARRAEDSCD